MQRSSDSIGTLAAALAKAQGELVNPEKSLVATIRTDNRGGGDRTFRYAPLSGGLDIVRKTLGQHEIATIQTTSLDQTAGIINLTTVLAHASGEWIASDWPVCPISETATPHRMGAALTYARRYALFTLVGIAGEDDLDAPDLVPPTSQSEPKRPKFNREKLNGGRLSGTAPTVAPRQRQKNTAPKLEAEASATLRDQLVAELNELTSGDDAALWAHRRLTEKNKLTDADAHQVEETFRARVRTFAVDANEGPQESAEQAIELKGLNTNKPKGQAQPAELDKSALALPEQRRIRDRDHVRSVAKQACLICGRQPSDAHHLRFAQHRALGRKVSDEFTVPLCRGHHRELHRCGDEAVWWSKSGIDPTVTARALWLESHPLGLGLAGRPTELIKNVVRHDVT
ncbi:MAG: ERF family protein [Hyphomicrobiales bacterium]|nr:ERF family protein [Hyphomicrobiales bacterium]